MHKLSLNEGKAVAQDHPAGKRKSWIKFRFRPSPLPGTIVINPELPGLIIHPVSYFYEYMACFEKKLVKLMTTHEKALWPVL